MRISWGPTVEALLASTAIPGIFPPVPVGEDLLIDGGVASNTPIATAVELGAERVPVLPAGFACALAAPPRGALALAVHALDLLIARQLVEDARRFSGKVELVFVPPLCPLGVSSYDFSRTAELIETADASTRRWLGQGGLQRGEVPHALRAHRHATAPVDALAAAESESGARRA